MSLLKHDEDDQLFSTPYQAPIKDKFWGRLLIGIFVLLTIFVVSMFLQAAF
jgi:hypothetical protein